MKVERWLRYTPANYELKFTYTFDALSFQYAHLSIEKSIISARHFCEGKTFVELPENY